MFFFRYQHFVMLFKNKGKVFILEGESEKSFKL
jgi:hypothetical protein